MASNFDATPIVAVLWALALVSVDVRHWCEVNLLVLALHEKR